MFDRLSQRLLPALQLTRMALVFTAVADGLCALLLEAQHTRLAVDPSAPIIRFINPGLVIAMILISIGLYGYGMGLNDVIDHRRDRHLASDRPLPSGRISLWSAHLICFGLATISLLGGGYYALHSPNGWQSFILVAWTGFLITLFDLAAKYLVAPGFLMLGLIRFFHALIPAPDMPMPWQPLLLLNHVAILAALAYFWGEKRPSLTRAHIWGIAGGLVFFDSACIGLLIWRRGINGLGLQWGLSLPAACAVLFVIAALWTCRHGIGGARAGSRLMRLGLLWVILYDAAFAAGCVGWKSGLLLLSFVPITWLGQYVLRFWSNLVALSQPPRFKRLRV